MNDKTKTKSVNYAKQTLKLYGKHIRKNKLMFGIAVLFIPASALMFHTT